MLINLTRVSQSGSSRIDPQINFTSRRDFLPCYESNGTLWEPLGIWQLESVSPPHKTHAVSLYYIILYKFICCIFKYMWTRFRSGCFLVVKSVARGFIRCIYPNHGYIINCLWWICPISQDCWHGIGAIVSFPQCHKSNPDEFIMVQFQWNNREWYA